MKACNIAKKLTEKILNSDKLSKWQVSKLYVHFKFLKKRSDVKKLNINNEAAKR